MNKKVGQTDELKNYCDQDRRQVTLRFLTIGRKRTELQVGEQEGLVLGVPSTSRLFHSFSFCCVVFLFILLLGCLLRVIGNGRERLEE